jgi:hypothetical protein
MSVVPASAGARPAGGGLRSQVMSFYTDDSPGLKIQPVRFQRCWLRFQSSLSAGTLPIAHCGDPSTRCTMVLACRPLSYPSGRTAGLAAPSLQVWVIVMSLGFILFVTVLHIIGKVGSAVGGGHGQLLCCLSHERVALRLPAKIDNWNSPCPCVPLLRSPAAARLKLLLHRQQQQQQQLSGPGAHPAPVVSRTSGGRPRRAGRGGVAHHGHFRILAGRWLCGRHRGKVPTDGRRLASPGPRLSRGSRAAARRLSAACNHAMPPLDCGSSGAYPDCLSNPRRAPWSASHSLCSLSRI